MRVDISHMTRIVGGSCQQYISTEEYIGSECILFTTYSIYNR